MKEIELVLKMIGDGLKALIKGIESAAEQIDALTKIKDTRKPEAAPKEKPAPKAKAKPAERAVAKKAPTASDTVYGIIKRSRNGVNMAALKKKTGFNNKKIANIVYKLKKQGKIKSAAKGVYVKV